MADVQIKVDATRALAKFNRIPVNVRDSLRGILPDLTKQVGTLVNQNLDAGLKSRTNIQVTQQLVENPRNIYGRVAAVWTGNSRSKLVPLYLEEGTKAHEIAAVNASALAFFWEKLGTNVFFKSVHHPGFAGIHYMKNAFNAMRGEIVADISKAVKAGARKQ